jgi:hypothetical protein
LSLSQLPLRSGFLVVFSGIAEVVAWLPNPKGIESISLGLRGTSYPRSNAPHPLNPERVASASVNVGDFHSAHPVRFRSWRQTLPAMSAFRVMSPASGRNAGISLAAAARVACWPNRGHPWHGGILSPSLAGKHTMLCFDPSDGCEREQAGEDLPHGRQDWFVIGMRTMPALSPRPGRLSIKNAVNPAPSWQKQIGGHAEMPPPA